MDAQQSQSTQPSSTTPNPGLLAGLSIIAKNAFGLIFSRIELIALELAEVRTVLLKLSVMFALAIVAAWFALAYWSALIVVLTWDSLGWKILLIMALVFTVAMIALLLYIRASLQHGKLSLHATMTELRRDRDALL
jgi:uncharacterized membrane protein YqjE